MPPKKLSVFEKTKAKLGLDDDVPESKQELFNIVAKRLPPASLVHKDVLIKLINEEGLSAKQVTVASDFVKRSGAAPVDEAELRTAAGVGVTYTREEILACIDKHLSANMDEIAKRRERYPFGRVMGLVIRELPWVPGATLKELIEERKAEVLASLGDAAPAAPAPAPAPAPAAAPAKAAVDLSDVSKLGPSLATLWGAIPKENRYEQLPEVVAEHERITGGKPLTRFPPEPNGYLHLGHAKSMFLNFGYAATHSGRTYLRFDDTNPEAEEQEYIDSIINDVHWLGHTPWKITYTSDYFDRLHAIAVELTRRGLCYVDDQVADDIKLFRQLRKDPPCRDRPAEESLRLFDEMRMGLHAEGSLTLRMRIDMQHDNACMRDPIAYRIKFCPHARTKDKWCIYPSYDFSHCLIDAFEHITHSMCTLEFEVRRPSYDWLTHIVGGYRPMQWEFSRLNVTHNVMSKRRLLRLVREGHVSGWDDPNLLTVSGLRRRGYTPSIINNFIRLVGISRADQLIETSLIEHCARTDFNRSLDRAMGVLDPILVVITDFAKDEARDIAYPLHPKDAARGTRPVPWRPQLFISADDFREEHGPEFYRLSPTQGVGLRYGPNIFVRRVVRNKAGRVQRIECTHDWARAEKCKAQIQWVPKAGATNVRVRIYNKLFLSPNPYSAEGDWINDLNPERVVTKAAHVLPFARDAPVGSRFQFERVGYFIKDADSTAKLPVFNRIIPLRDSLPEGMEWLVQDAAK